MTQAQMLEGTIEEITRQLQQSYAGQKLRVYVEPETLEQANLSADLPDPLFTVRSQEQLEQLLLEAIDSPTHEVTDETWEQKRHEIHRRHAARQAQS